MSRRNSQRNRQQLGAKVSSTRRKKRVETSIGTGSRPKTRRGSLNPREPRKQRREDLGSSRNNGERKTQMSCQGATPTRTLHYSGSWVLLNKKAQNVSNNPPCSSHQRSRGPRGGEDNPRLCRSYLQDQRADRQTHQNVQMKRMQQIYKKLCVTSKRKYA